MVESPVFTSEVGGEIYGRIWDLALPYQDKRNDVGHAATVVHYAKRLLQEVPADPKVVIPAVILHDIGWTQVDEGNRMASVMGTLDAKTERQVRLQHQEEGVRLARGILEEVGYEPELTEEILEIISGHDTRIGFLSPNNAIVRDADKLWRFSQIGFDAHLRRSGRPANYSLKQLASEIDKEGYFFSEAAKEVDKS